MVYLCQNFTIGIVAISVLFYIVYKYLTYYYNYWKDKNVIFKKPTLLFGTIKDIIFGRITDGTLYSRIYKEFQNEKYVGTFQLREPELTIRDLDMIKQVLVKDSQHFVDRLPTMSDKVEKLNANLFFVNGKKWRATRQKLTPVFTSGKLKYMFPLVVEKAEEFQSFLTNEVKISDEQDVKGLMARFTVAVIGSVAFGIQMNSIADANDPFRQMGQKIFEFTPLQISKDIVRFVFPKFFDFFSMRVLKQEIEDFFTGLVKSIVAQRSKENVKRNDFIDLMLELKGKGNKVDGSMEERLEITDDFMAAQAFIFFAAGFETSSGVMSFALYELAKKPDVQEKLILEIDNVLEKYEGKLSYDSILEMEYLECVVNETMRMYPALGVLTRTCTSNKYTFPETNLTIDKGVHIAIPVLALHYNPQYYPDPHEFKPERFSAAAKQERNSMAFLPFGDGARNCIGLRFGKMQSMIGLASLLSKFTVEKSSKTEKKLKIKTNSFVTSPTDGIWLKLKPRT